MFHNLRRQITTVFLLALLSTSVLSASSSKEHNLTDAQLHAVMGIITSFILSDTTSPREQALTKIQTYAQSDGNTPTPTIDDYIDAQVTEVDARLLDAVNETMVLMDATDVDSTVKIQQIVDVILSVPPLLTLIGEVNTTLELGVAYVEEGATAIDALDDNLTAQIVMVGSVDESLLGSYTITYSITDEDNNSVTIERNITVVDTTAPTFTSDDNATVAENQTSAITLVATDATAIVYSISGGQSDSFDINATTGVVTFKTSPDFETLATYGFTATATDSSGNAATQELSIYISDIAEGQAPKMTGQTKSYNADGDVVIDGSIKDDGFYQKGTAPSYTRDDATDIVTDHITHLEWADDATVKSIKKRWLTEENYDKCTGENDQTKDPSKCIDTSGDTATTYCQGLVLGGHSDWRLPSIDELDSIADRSRRSPAIDTSMFQNIVSHYYWSSSMVVGDEGYVWGVYFDDGIDGWYRKSYSNYVRCVRDGE